MPKIGVDREADPLKPYWTTTRFPGFPVAVSDEVRESYARYAHNAYPVGHFGDTEKRNVGYLSSDEGWNDRRVLAEAMCAILSRPGIEGRKGADGWRPFDEDEPVTPKWMEDELNIYDCHAARDLKRYELFHEGTVRVLFHACAGPLCWEPSIWVGTKQLNAKPTRGAVRQLLAALGIPTPPK